MNEASLVKNTITIAVCSFNSAHYLPVLLEKLISQECSIPFEILIIDNNSTDNTYDLVKQFSEINRTPIRYVNESDQGIPYARNRAIEESLSSRYLAFIDADEIPEQNWLQTAISVLSNETIDCVGGKITVALPVHPTWLDDNLLPFYGEINHSDQTLQIVDASTPIWSGNIAYNMRIFQQGLRFDTRYNRKGKGVGGGEDEVMFTYLLQHHYHLVYEPKMAIQHLIPDEKIKRGYFLKLHFTAGRNAGLYEIKPEGKKIFGIPGFMFFQLLKKTQLVIVLFALKRQPYMREAMNIAYQAGMIVGLYHANKTI